MNECNQIRNAYSLRLSLYHLLESCFFLGGGPELSAYFIGGGCLNACYMRARGEGGSKKAKKLRAYYINGPQLKSTQLDDFVMCNL